MTPTSPAPSSAGAAAPALRVGDPRATVRQGLVDAELFAGCADRTLERLVAASTLVRLPPGGILCHAGDAMHDLFVIIEGTVSASRTLPDGRRQVGGVLGPGQCELADMLGVTRQSVNRVLRGLEDEGLLKLGRGAIELSDPTRLSRAQQR